MACLAEPQRLITVCFFRHVESTLWFFSYLSVFFLIFPFCFCLETKEFKNNKMPTERNVRFGKSLMNEIKLFSLNKCFIDFANSLHMHHSLHQCPSHHHHPTSYHHRLLLNYYYRAILSLPFPKYHYKFEYLSSSLCNL